MFNLSINYHAEPRRKQKKEKWRLFQAKDLQSLMYPCFTLCHIFGIFPYKINAFNLEISKPYYILSTVVTCIFGIYTLIILFNISFFGKLNMASLPEILADCTVYVFGGFIVIVTFILTGPQLRLFQTILMISSRLPVESYEKLSKLIHTKDIIGFLVVVPALFFPTIQFALTLDYFYLIYTDLVVFLVDMFYMNCVCVLKACFKRINDNLTNMKSVIENNESHISRLNYHDQRNQFLIMELKALKKEHLAISDTVQMLNMTFSLHLLATVVMVFSIVTITLYYYILFCLHLLFNDVPRNVLHHTSFVMYMLCSTIKITLIVWACETGKNQAQQMSVSIHDVFNITTNEQIKYELQLFSLQILHCNNTFGAKGLTVDAKLFAEIVGCIATYIIIMFQFKFFSCEKEMANNITEVI
ncbi:PREDICTED: uncharacterized protein LOC105568929 [Vollenhovia emeryi]|uniref:uncharacterized protein LOC105568929 n=1 Tax=Vollenhovia emeryi TaxID=411798 RepID=UPI0005F38EFC|nr:PREDICTED: uncharacterized protein LOC105568929 [Vollenhovia emeryi]